MGGRICTRRFTSERHQYYEAGAMRIPKTKFHISVERLVNELNQYHQAGLKVIPYTLTYPGNLIFVNGIRSNDNNKQTAKALGFTNVPEPYADKTGPELLYEAIRTFVDILQEDFEKGWELLLEYDHCSFRSYLLNIERWPPSVIEFVETMCSQTNQFILSFPEMVMQSMDFKTKDWWTLEDGMDRLPEALARVVGLENITFGARVQKVTKEQSDRIRIQAFRGGHVFEEVFDKVLLAIPPGAVRMIVERPLWPLVKEQGLRSMFFEPLYKIGIRFKSRFWEHTSPPSLGGQSTTDLPIRWIVYPSYGIEEEGPGVLLLYSWMTDALLWSSITFEQRVHMALTHLNTIYAQFDVDVFDQFIAADDTPWAERNPMGDAMFLPGQYTEFFATAIEPEGNIYFAGEHLSRHHTWIAGALDSANTAVQQMLKAWSEESHKIPYLRPVKGVEDGFVPVIGDPEAPAVREEDERKKILREGLLDIRADPVKFRDSILKRNTIQKLRPYNPPQVA